MYILNKPRHREFYFCHVPKKFSCWQQISPINDLLICKEIIIFLTLNNFLSITLAEAKDGPVWGVGIIHGWFFFIYN